MIPRKYGFLWACTGARRTEPRRARTRSILAGLAAGLAAGVVACSEAPPPKQVARSKPAPSQVTPKRDPAPPTPASSSRPIVEPPTATHFPDGCEVDGVRHLDGDVFSHADALNCICWAGEVRCASKAEDVCYYYGRWLKVGQSTRSIDDCNTIRCNKERGRVAMASTASGCELVLGIDFAAGSTRLPAGAAAVFKKVKRQVELPADFPERLRPWRVSVIGCAEEGSERAAALAKARAAVVHEALLKEGVPNSQLSISDLDRRIFAESDWPLPRCVKNRVRVAIGSTMLGSMIKTYPAEP